jgi:hypothetical protein
MSGSKQPVLKGVPMKAPHTSDVTHTLNHLRKGSTYRATTPDGSAVGEYLGMESPHGDRAILLRHRRGTASIDLRNLRSLHKLVA